MKRYHRITPEGTRDLLFEDCIARREVEGCLTELFTQRGFTQVMTPGLEYYDVFFGSAPMLPAEDMYKLCDAKGRLLVMRPDSTLPIARLAAARLKNAKTPIRLFYAQDVYRLNRSLTGHSDQEFQAGVELLGAKGPRADLDLLSLAAEALQRTGCREFRIELGHVGVFRSLMGRLDVGQEVRDTLQNLIETKNYAALSGALDGLPDSPAVEAIRHLPRLFGGEEVLEEAGRLCGEDGAKEALQYIETLYRSLCAMGLREQVMIDLGLVHRHEYYTGMVFRGYIDGSGETVVSGGRYDTLLEQFGWPLPATGFGINVDALTKSRLDRGVVSHPAPPDVVVFSADGCEPLALQKVSTLCQEGQCCEFSVLETLEETRAYATEKGIGRLLAVTPQGVYEETLEGTGSPEQPKR